MSHESQALQELLQVKPGKAEYDSYLVKRCHELMAVRLADYSVEDLRIMIGQKIGLEYLIPKAVEVLRQEPLMESNFYPGDLLANVLSCPASFWQNNSTLAVKMRQVLETLELDKIDIRELRNLIEKYMLEYSSRSQTNH
jgi:hypothetical protein